MIERFSLDRMAARPITLWHSVGCAARRGTGLRARPAVAEFLIPDEAVQRLIFSRAGIAVTPAGSTTLEEIGRSIQADG
jgi:general secretion pathway protein E